jgi:hypothetical protein
VKFIEYSDEAGTLMDVETEIEYKNEET